MAAPEELTPGEVMAAAHRVASLFRGGRRALGRGELGWGEARALLAAGLLERSPAFVDGRGNAVPAGHSLLILPAVVEFVRAGAPRPRHRRKRGPDPLTARLAELGAELRARGLTWKECAGAAAETLGRNVTVAMLRAARRRGVRS